MLADVCGFDTYRYLVCEYRVVELASSLQVGANGNGFAINNNGFVLFHPALNRKVKIKIYIYFKNSCFAVVAGKVRTH